METFHLLALCAMFMATVSAAPKKLDLSDHLKAASGCHGKPAELLFLLDSSSSIWSVDFKKQLKFVSELIDNFEIGPNRTRVGVASFSYKYRPNIAIDRYDNAEDLKTAISSIRQYYGGTYTYDALDGVRTEGLNKNIVRPGVVKIVMVLTDGKSADDAKTKEAAMKLKEEAIVFAVGIGSRTDRDELTAIASEPTENYLFEVGNYGLLDTIKDELAITACEAELKDESDAAPACGATNPADIMFIVEPSELGIDNSMQIFTFISELTTDFNMASGNIQVGLDSSHCGDGNIMLGEYTDSNDMAVALRNMEVSGLGNKIRRLRTHAFEEANGGRPRARHMAVIFVDDKLYDSKEVIDQARRTMHYDVELFVVAIGNSVVDNELQMMCSSPLDRHLIRVPSYEDLPGVKPQFLKQFCHGL